MNNLLKFRVKVLAITAILLISISGILSAQKIAIIDAGSSGSRLYVYDINKNENKISILYPVQEEESSSKGMALSSVNNHKDDVKTFLNTMTRKYKHEESIPLYILATAGMRKMDKKNADEIYKKINEIARDGINGFKIEKAMTISGRYEGLYAWLAANYKNGKIEVKTLNSKPALSCIKDSLQNGILEIGGVSMQIAFQTNGSNTNEYIFRKGLGYIYSKSYLGGGVDSVYNKNKNNSIPNFNIGLNDVSILYRKELQFYGLGKPIENVLDNAAKKGVSVRDYPSVCTLEKKDDSPTNFHPWINTHYIAWVVRTLKLDGRLVKPTIKSDWTEGAALDIIINNEKPEEFDYTKCN